MRYFPLLAIAAAVLVPGCAFGPKVLESSHGKYAAAVQRVEEEQLLKNIVRLRYLEAPRHLDVSAIAAQYELAGSAEVRPFYSTEAANGIFRSFTAFLPFAAAGGANRPTISLDPQDDATTIRQFLTPISDDTLVFLVQSGWPVSSVVRIWADRLNGVPNAMPGSGPPRDVPSDVDRFKRIAELLQLAQDREWLEVRAEDRITEVSDLLPNDAVDGMAAAQAAKDKFEFRKKGDGWVLIKRERRLVIEVNSSGQGRPELAELESLLNLKPGQTRYELIVASGVTDPAKNPREPDASFRVTPRSTAQALFFLANGVEVPPKHVSAGLVHWPTDGTDPTIATEGLFRVRSCPGHPWKPPAGAYVAVWYRDHWFYIDDRDQASKATLVLMLQLRRLDFQRQRLSTSPALTLPVGR
ncbi:MAG: hypothetical protein NZM31_11500 [Gemmatales bacterium]|nr:hypothetical protein [Gemmatales bacterium]MDW8387620.1 hypothetical protein [Gemmatales bacterium]